MPLFPIYYNGNTKFTPIHVSDLSPKSDSAITNFFFWPPDKNLAFIFLTFSSSSISLFNLISATKDLDKRSSLQRDINRVSIKAAEFAIPNEFDRLVEGLGGTGLNADTWNDFVRYYNSFPSNEIEKWLEIYSHRFINPVFRLFQAELEIVYEEKNRAMDNPFRIFYETFTTIFFTYSSKIN